MHSIHYNDRYDDDFHLSYCIDYHFNDRYFDIYIHSIIQCKWMIIPIDDNNEDNLVTFIHSSLKIYITRKIKKMNIIKITQIRYVSDNANSIS